MGFSTGYAYAITAEAGTSQIGKESTAKHKPGNF
jgi:hypothetical protein